MGQHNNIKLLLLIAYSLSGLSALYTYDRVNNRQITLDTGFNNVYYTSNNFHSIEYASLHGAKNITSQNVTTTLIKLRKSNATKSLPNLYSI